MGFTPLTQQQIEANLINTYAALITTADDLNRGSVVRSLLTAFAVEMRRLYANMVEEAAEVQQTAAYAAFNFPRLPAQAAYTMEQFTVSQAPTQDVTVPGGTLIKIPGTSIQYQTIADFIWPSGTTSQSIRIACTQVGSLGNTQANTITQLMNPIAGLGSVQVTNIRDVKTGSDQETEEQRAQRFANFLATIHRGDSEALKYGAMTAQLVDQYGYVTEQVAKAQLVEGNGSNTIYIDNGDYSTSTDLVTKCQQVINGYIDSNGNPVIGYKVAGIPSAVQAAAIQTVSVSVSVTPVPGYTLQMIQQSVIDSITSLVTGLNVGDTLYQTSIGLAVGNVAGVMNYVIHSPASDTIPAAGTLLCLDSSSPIISQL